MQPRAKGGGTDWDNIVTACGYCNRKKAARSLKDIKDMSLKQQPHQPTWPELHQKARAFPPKELHADWEDYIL